MATSERPNLTDFSRLFLEPSNSTHRQYEALRAYFVEKGPSAEVAERFGYTPGSFRVLCHDFRRQPGRAFFLTPKKGPQVAPKVDPAREKLISLRKQNLSVYDIQRSLRNEGHEISPAWIAKTLKDEGFARLPRRRDDERPFTVHPSAADVADVRQLDLSPRTFRTRFGGLFLFVPYLAQIPLDRVLKSARFPGSKMIPAEHAIRSLLALKLFGTARHSHVMSYVFDPGLALFCGLNAIPKRSFLTEYSCRIRPDSYVPVMKKWFECMGTLGIERGVSFDLDFHTIPYHGDDALIEKHYVSKRSRRQKGILAFLAEDSGRRVFCYGNADLKKETQAEEIMRFARFWKRHTETYPDELVFDSKLTTYANLNELNRLGINFITLRRRSKNMLLDAHRLPESAWRRIQLKGIARAYRTPKIIDKRVELTNYDGPIRQLVIKDLGHEEPTFLITNQLTRTPVKLITRYAQRMIIENSIADGIDFFHMDALSSAVAMKVSCDLQLTLMGSSLYRLLGQEIGNGYETAKSRHLFRDFIDASAVITVDPETILVRFQKRAHNPLLLSAGFADKPCKIPWLGNRELRLVFG